MLRKIIVLFFLAALSFPVTYAQSPYSLNWKTDGIIMGSASVLLAADILALNSMEALTTGEITGLDQYDINRMDRWVFNRESPSADFRSDVGLAVSSAISAASVVAIPFNNKEKYNPVSEFMMLSVIWLETNIINFEGTGLFKNTVQRIRPEVYMESFLIENFNDAELFDLKRSYFSRHVSVSAANTFFFAKVFSDYYPESEWKPVVWGVAAVLPAWISLERLHAGKHFPSDVISGYIFGAACGYFIPHFHKRKEDKLVFNLQARPFFSQYGNGASVHLKF